MEVPEEQQPQQPFEQAPTSPEAFDAKVLQAFGELVHRQLRTCPELRGVGIVLDFQGELNEVVKSGAWITRTSMINGNRSLPEIFGSLEQTGRLMSKQMETALNVISQMAQKAKELHDQIIEGEAIRAEQTATEDS
jgi:hypothetical protein